MTVSRILRTHDDSVFAIAVAPTATHVASGSRDGEVAVLDYSSGAEIFRARAGARVTSLAYSPDGNVLAAAMRSHLAIWGGNLQAPVRLAEHAGVECVAFAPDGTLFSGGENGLLRSWDRQAATVGREVRLPVERIVDLCVFGDVSTLLAATSNGRIYLLDPTQLTVRSEVVFDGQRVPIYRCRATTDANMLAASVHYSTGTLLHQTLNPMVNPPDRYEIAIWDQTSGGSCDRDTNLVGHFGWIGALAFSPEADLLLSGAADHALRLWDPNQRTCLATCREHRGFIYGCQRYIYFSVAGAPVLYPTCERLG